MRVAVLSGKGGTGKTLVSVNLASVMDDITYVDADVEEPNGNLFLKPTDIRESEVSIALPKWHSDSCTRCRRCVDFCAFNALALVKDKMLIFDEVCHSCGGCELVCPSGAFGTRHKAVGKVTEGKHGNIRVLSGMLNIGEASGVPIIEELMRLSSADENIIIDCPPGSACTVMASIKDVDYCILVAEPTIFGVSNLDMVVRLAKVFGKKVGVVLNKCVDGENVASDYCNEHGIDVIGNIGWDTHLAHITSSGEIASEVDERYRAIFGEIADKVAREVRS